MFNNKTKEHITIFSTCPQSKDVDREHYYDRVVEVAKWSEMAGCKGILVYTDNGIADPWLVAQTILHNTTHLSPLVAVQPVYMLPYTAAKMVSTLAFIYNRRLYLNMVAGGFRGDLIALDDNTPHDERYLRTVEYTKIIRQLLESDRPVTFEGKYYKTTNLKLAPTLPPELFPGLLISGSSEAGLAAAAAINATAIKYPRSPIDETGIPNTSSIDCGVRVGVIARKDNNEAWRVAHERFPENRKGQITHQLAMKISDSSWHYQLSELDPNPNDGHSRYWLGPFQNYQTFCPYLVGDYDRVGDDLAVYISKGYRTFILDIPRSVEDLEHTSLAFEKALQRLPS